MNRYTLGPLDAPAFVLTDTSQRGQYGPGAVDSYGVTWLCDYPVGWDDVVFNTPVDVVVGSDGGLVAPQSLGVRQIGIIGVAIAPNQVERARAQRRLRAALPRRGPVRFAVVDEDGQRLWVDAYPSGTYKAVPRGGDALVFSFGLVAVDQYKRGDTARSQTTTLPDPSAQPGIVLPITLGTLVFGGGAGPVGGSVNCPNYGDTDAFPIATIDGPVVDPIARNATTGAYVQWSITLAAGSRMVVDFATGLTTVDGLQRDVPLIGTGSDFWTLPPGTSQVEFRARSVYDPAADLTVGWFDTYQ